MLPQWYSVSVTDFGLSEKAVTCSKGFFQPEIAEIPVLQSVYLRLINANIFGTDLLIVADNDRLLCKVLQEKGLGTALTSLVNNNDVKTMLLRINGFSHSIKGHDPSWDRFPTFVHVFLSRAAVGFGVFAGPFANPLNLFFPCFQIASVLVGHSLKAMTPRSCGSQRRNIVAESLIDISPLGLQGIEIVLLLKLF